MRARQQVPCLFNGQLPKEVEQAYTEALIIMQGRCWAYYSVLLNTTVVWTVHPEVKTLATDGAYVYVNPNFFLSLTPVQRAFGLAHEVGHIVLRHPMRGQFYKARGFHSLVDGAQLSWDHKQYNRAADFVINADLVAHDLEPIPDILFDDRFGRDDLVDQVYITVMAEQQAEQDSAKQASDDYEESDEYSDDDTEGDPADDELEAGEGEGDDAGSDEAQPSAADENTEEVEVFDEDSSSSSDKTSTSDGEESSGAAGKSTEGEDTEGEATGDELSATEHDGHDAHLEPQYDGTPEEQAAAEQEDREAIERKIDDALESLEDAMNRGERHCSPSGPMGEAGYIHAGDGVASGTNWSGELIEEVTRSGTGGEQCFAPINRRKFVNYGIIAPTEMGSFDRLGFVIDISGSVSRTQLQKACVEVANAIDMLEPTSGALVMFVNTDIHSWYEIQTGQELLDLDIPMCGCTFLSSAVDWMDQMGFDCDLVLAFTDGELDDSDWLACAEANWVILLDSHPDCWIQQNLNATGIKHIICADEQLAA